MDIIVAERFDADIGLAARWAKDDRNQVGRNSVPFPDPLDDGMDGDRMLGIMGRAVGRVVSSPAAAMNHDHSFDWLATCFNRGDNWSELAHRKGSEALTQSRVGLILAMQASGGWA